jgi:hypothetical protein
LVLEDVSFTDQFGVDYVSQAYALTAQRTLQSPYAANREILGPVCAFNLWSEYVDRGEHGKHAGSPDRRYGFPQEHALGVGVGSKPRSTILG